MNEIVASPQNQLTPSGSVNDGSGIQKLSPEQTVKVQEIANSIDINNNASLTQFGTGAQAKISAFSDSILEKVRSKDAGDVGTTLRNLMNTIQGFDAEGLVNHKKGLLSSLFNAAKSYMERYQRLETQIDVIQMDLDRQRVSLLRDITVFDQMFKNNYESIGDLNMYILAGEMKLKELNDSIIPAAQAQAKNSGAAEDAQKANDLMQLATRFDKKIYDLKLTKTSALQRAPQIRLIQGGDQVLVDKIQTSILLTIPIWKDQVVLAIGLQNQQKGLMMQQKVTETTNDLLRKNSELLKTNTLEIAQESEKGIIELDTLKQVNQDLISTIKETIQIQQDGKAKRQAAEIELEKMQQELRQQLIANR